MKLEELQNRPREERSPLENCIVDAARLEDERDGDYTVVELALDELEYLREKRYQSVHTYDIANAAVDELFTKFGVQGQTIRVFVIEKDDQGKRNEIDLGGWAKIPARDIILKHIRAALKISK